MPPKKKPKNPCGTCNNMLQQILCCVSYVICGITGHHTTIECLLWHSKETIAALLEVCKDESCWSCQKCSAIMKKLNGRLTAVDKSVETVKTEIIGIQTQLQS